jgi:hypothetical protein
MLRTRGVGGDIPPAVEDQGLITVSVSDPLQRRLHHVVVTNIMAG